MKNERGEGGGEHEQRAYSRVKSHHGVTVGWSMKRNLWDLLRGISAPRALVARLTVCSPDKMATLFLGITT